MKISTFIVLVTLAVSSVAAADSCPRVFRKGTLDLDWNPAFVHVDRYDTPWGFKAAGLTVSSFFNSFIIPGGTPPRGFFERDLVARIPGIAWVNPSSFDASRDVEVLTDLGPVMPATVWPNEAVRAPDGVFPFEAVVVPQGFFTAQVQGRLTAIDVSDPSRTEYIIDQSTQAPGGFTFPGDPSNSPKFYHRALFIDMNGDGMKDIVSVRSGFRVGPSVYPPFGELVYFENPGAAIDPSTEWAETVLWGGPPAGFLGPDIHLDAHDFEGDGVPEIVATHFFSGEAAPPGGPPPMNGTINIYGAPVGGTWADVDAAAFALPRVAVISANRGFPFDIEIVDLNKDGRSDILATNHQPDGCSPPTSSATPGRVYAFEPPASGDLFGEAWPEHVLLDGIFPQPTPPPVSPPGRLAPGSAQAFWPIGAFRNVAKPNIIVGGDEAGKVWVLTPENRWASTAWNYDAAVVFDINDVYGPNTTQTPLADPFGITISTIGTVAVRNAGPRGRGLAEIYIPVFEAKQIHILSYRRTPGSERVACVEDVLLACAAP